MKFTIAEMIYLISIADGPKPFGMFCTVYEGEEKASFYDTMECLKRKELFDDKERLTDLGCQILFELETYKKAGHHISINGIFLAWGTEDTLIAAVPHKDGYDLLSLPFWTVWHSFMSTSDYLRPVLEYEADEQTDYGIVFWEKVRMDGEVRHYAVVEQFEEKQMVAQKVYIVEAGRGFLENRLSGEQTELKPQDMGIDLLVECTPETEPDEKNTVQ